MSALSSLGNSLAGLSTNGLGVNGLASGLDTNAIIQAMLSFQQAQITNLQAQQARIAAQQNAFQTIQSDLSAFQTQAQKLGQALNSPFDAKVVTSSDNTTATGAASASAAPGVYTFTVNNLAAAQQIASQGFSSASASITHGTLQIKVGTGASTTITVDSSNDTLQGLANAINNAGADVTAAIVNTGAGSNPYELVLTSKDAGAANTIAITNNLAADGGGAVKPLLNTTVQPAADASITVGSGPGALTITNPSNTLNGVFAGVTINLAAANPGKTVTLTVANDSVNAQKAVQSFVDSYNALIDFISKNTSYDPKTQQAGLLLGQQAPSAIEQDLGQALTSVVGGVSAKANHLAAIGLTLDDKGHLQVDSGKLSNALSGQVAGVSSTDIRRLFALDGQSDNQGVQFISGSDKTVASATPYQVVITQAATQASFLASNALNSSIVINGANNTFTVTVNGKTSGTITLSQGTYTPATIAQEVQAEINKDSQVGNGQVVVSVDASGKLKFTSQLYGAASQVSIGTGTALAALGLAGTEKATGQDVAGYFQVNGVKETATGSGQLLSGNSGNAHTQDLQVRVTLTPAQVGSQTQSNLTVTRGIASQLNQVLNRYLDPTTGRLKSVNDNFQTQSNDIQRQIDFQTKLMQQQQQALVQQFAALEGTVSQLKSVGNLLSVQLAGLVNTSTNSSKG
jgi:flagellar hook-associated protein 2